ncbi:hypothetical protein P43SY_004322 [Pythium insidiosum]|uniref:Conserved oligomeric Golgi complex subunit 7 n=1 Tax=Pythium insidiosum TaxID=114742 RepID=A0AAD5Q4A2_PYTIN|nr:hypothetical protein P43SY_004322 [Pythium insidiosum]
MELLSDEVFGDAAFNCYAWLEEAVIEREGHIPGLVELVPQLSLLSQSLTTSIHSSLHQLSITGPQLQAQLDALQRVSAPLAQQLEAVTSAMTSDATGGSRGHRRESPDEQRELEHLLTLHDAKTRLLSCSKALVEAARWEKNVRACALAIESSLDGVVAPLRRHSRSRSGSSAVASPSTDEPSAPSLADRVAEMHKSLEILRDMPGADDRHRTLDRLCAQIETALKPQLEQFLQETPLPVGPIQASLAVFRSIGRGDYVAQAYCRTRPAHLHRLWFSYSSSSEDDKRLSAWLESFYDEVARMLQRETDHVREIFGQGDDVDREHETRVVLDLLQNVWRPLHDSFRERLRKADGGMPELLRAFHQACAFASHAGRILRGSSSTEDRVAQSIAAAVFTPFQFVIESFEALATQHLTTALTARVPSLDTGHRSGDDDDEGEAASADAFARHLENSKTAVVTALDDSFRVCYELTGGVAFPECVSAAQAAIGAWTNALRATTLTLRRSLGVDGADRVEGHDWDRFHSTLALLRACGAIESDLVGLEQRLRVRMGEQLQGLVVSGPPSPRSRRQQWVQTGARLPLESLVNETPTRIAASVALSWLQQRQSEPADRLARLAALNEDLQTSSEIVPELLRQPFAGYTRDVQRLVYDSVHVRMVKVLERVPTMECWTKGDDATASLSDLPSFSTLPQDYITVVADLLLSLLPQLEPFAASGSLSLAAAASRQVDSVCAEEWEAWARALPSAVRLSGAELESCRQLFCLPEGPSSESDVEQDAAAQFVDAWTGVMASGTTAALLSAISSIPSLSPLGAKQLAADVGYFVNVLGALGFGGDDNFVVRELHAALEQSDEEIQSRAEELRQPTPLPEDGDDDRQRARTRVTLALVEMVRGKRQAAMERKPRCDVVDDPNVRKSSQYF